MPLSRASWSWRCRSRGRPTRRATAKRFGALSGNSKERLSNAASGRRRRAARSTPTITSNIATVIAAKKSSAWGVPDGRGRSRLRIAAVAIPAAAGAATTQKRTSLLSTGRRCHWWLGGSGLRSGGAVGSEMVAVLSGAPDRVHRAVAPGRSQEAGLLGLKASARAFGRPSPRGYRAVAGDAKWRPGSDTGGR